jgi:hypothetical protein
VCKKSCVVVPVWMKEYEWRYSKVL